MGTTGRNLHTIWLCNTCGRRFTDAQKQKHEKANSKHTSYSKLKK